VRTQGNGRPKAAAESSCSAGDDRKNSTRPMPFAEAALSLAGQGWPVFPLAPGDKVPLISKAAGGNGFRDGTTNLAQVEAWARRYPTANIGARIPEHMILVDVDPRNGSGETVSRWESEYGPLPATLTVWSGRGDGGHHRYYLMPNFEPALRRLCGTGIDLKTHKVGYAVMPYSIHPDSGEPYLWAEPLRPPVPLPQWFKDLIRPVKPSRPKGPMNVHSGSGSGLPSERFAESHTWAEVLEPFGWRECDRMPGRWLRPGRDRGSSASVVTARDGAEVLHVFSSNGGPLEVDRSYNKFGVWAALAHGGDWKAATAALQGAGRDGGLASGGR